MRSLGRVVGVEEMYIATYAIHSDREKVYVVGVIVEAPPSPKVVAKCSHHHPTPDKAMKCAEERIRKLKK